MSHGQLHQIGIVETGSSRRMLMKECQGDDRDKHQHATGLRKQEEFERGVPAMRVPPDGNQEIHGDQHELPKEEKQEQIDGQKHPNDATQGQQDVTVEKSDATLDFCPGGTNREETDEGRQEDEYHAETIEAEMQTNAPARNPTAVTFYEPGTVT